MRVTIMYGAGDVRIENVTDASLVDATDAVVRVTRACICGSDLWPYKEMPESDGAGRVFDRVINLDAVPDGYRAMDQRESIKVMINF